MDSLSRPAATSSGKGSSAASRSSSRFSRSRCRLEGFERPLSAACSLRGAATATRYGEADTEPAPSIPHPEASPALNPDPAPSPSPAPIPDPPPSPVPVSHPDPAPAPSPAPTADPAPSPAPPRPAPHSRSGRRLPPLAPRVHGSARAGDSRKSRPRQRGAARSDPRGSGSASSREGGRDAGTLRVGGWAPGPDNRVGMVCARGAKRGAGLAQPGEGCGQSSPWLFCTYRGYGKAGFRLNRRKKIFTTR